MAFLLVLVFSQNIGMYLAHFLFKASIITVHMIHVIKSLYLTKVRVTLKHLNEERKKNSVECYNQGSQSSFGSKKFFCMKYIFTSDRSVNIPIDEAFPSRPRNLLLAWRGIDQSKSRETIWLKIVTASQIWLNI